jgi:UDP-3-O-[3-hydroxymyristoyl] glucosamine N-acyltransferase
VIVSPAMREAAAARGAFIVADDPYLYFARVTQLWKAHARPDTARIHPSAVIDPRRGRPDGAHRRACAWSSAARASAPARCSSRV